MLTSALLIAVLVLTLSAVLASLALVAVLVSSSGDDQTGNVPPGNGTTVTAEPGGPCSGRFGGPYPTGGELEKKVLDKKQVDFATYKGLQLFSSETLNLTDDPSVFPTSVEANSTLQQKYNYVITEDCDILVAVWGDDGLSQIESEVVCKGGSDDNFRMPTPGNMINWAPEEPYGSVLASNPTPRRQSPCWLDTKRENGILDAISKHFMLAQESNGNDKGQIEQYTEQNRAAWANTSVAYAGEILVDPNACTYIVTEDSGTYKPSGEYRLAANQFFATALNPGLTGAPTLPNRVPDCDTPTLTATSTPTS